MRYHYSSLSIVECLYKLKNIINIYGFNSLICVIPKCTHFSWRRTLPSRLSP
ncbi:MAG: hypothetical protein DRQ62_05705 [Gammaproteobacteria bacterium]|nr:MAG: hypothetical protein DRQ62_05705 [Gammaproteobacteria bacterium]